MSVLLQNAPAPDVAVELASHQVSAAALERRGGKPVVAMHATATLPEGALVPSLIAPNIAGKLEVVEALKRVLDEVGRPRRVGLIVPDPVAKVSLIRFAQTPGRAEDLDQLVRWQMRKAAPFPIDEAQISYFAGARVDDGYEYVVSVARRTIIEEYEAICSAAGAHAGVVDISTFNVINALLAGTDTPAADWLLVNVAADYTSIAILRGADLVFFRSRALEGEGALADLVHQTAMYYEDRLQGGGFAKVMLSGASSGSAPAEVRDIRRGLEERLGTAVEAVDARTAVGLTDRISAAPALLDTLAPLVGLLLRDRGAVA